MNTTLYYAGFGCRHHCEVTALSRLLDQALADYGLTIAQIGGIASIDNKREEPALLVLATQLQLPLSFFSAQQLRAYQYALSEQSAITLRITGSGSVAEASALALTEQCAGSLGELIIKKRKNSDATFALARVVAGTSREST